MLNGHLEKQSDHAFLCSHIRIPGAEYVRASGGFTFAGKGPDALSDHAPLLVEVERLPTGR